MAGRARRLAAKLLRPLETANYSGLDEDYNFVIIFGLRWEALLGKWVTTGGRERIRGRLRRFNSAVIRAPSSCPLDPLP